MTPTKYQTSSPTGRLHMHAWRMSLRRLKSTIISWDGSYRQERDPLYTALHKTTGYTIANQATELPVCCCGDGASPDEQLPDIEELSDWLQVGDVDKIICRAVMFPRLRVAPPLHIESRGRYTMNKVSEKCAFRRVIYLNEAQSKILFVCNCLPTHTFTPYSTSFFCFFRPFDISVSIWNTKTL